MPVRLVTTALKRVWLVNPSKGDEQALPSASELEQDFHFALQVNSNYITGASPGRAWDDALWYVFGDFYQSLKLEARHIGKFAPEISDVVALWHIEPPVDHASALVKTAFERDAFLYPVWLLLNITPTVIADEQRHSWVADGNSWTAGIWVRHGREITVVFTSESGIPLDHQNLVAVLAKGQCEPRQVLRPMVFREGESLDPDAPESATRTAHLARAVWLYAGETTDDCTHDSIFENVDARTIDYSQTQVLPADSGGSHEKLYETSPNGHTIRLLKIEHAAEGHDLVARLTLVDLRDAPQDQIYALLGMPFSGNDPEQGALLKPNYSQDIRSVYTQAVQRILQQDEHLRVLSSIHHGAEIDISWPAWVPKWNKSYKAEPLALREEQGYYSNAGELFIPDDYTFSPDGERIYLNDIECATVTEVGNVMTKHEHGIAAMSREKDSKALMSILHTLSNEDN
ncbi:putative Heterokaryon incompatibility protein-domain-containing protein [Seiridium cardinale]